MTSKDDQLAIEESTSTKDSGRLNSDGQSQSCAVAACAESTPEEQDLEFERSKKALESYNAFLSNPGPKCSSCWLLRRHCCCSGMPRRKLRIKVCLFLHHIELSQRRSSNTAKVLLHFGAELFVWGIDNQRIREVIDDDQDRTVVLFPGPGAVPAKDLSHEGFSWRPVQNVIVLDGGWRETTRMNSWLGATITRCFVESASRAEFGGTRKYAGGDNRVQTAAAFVAFLRELGEDNAEVEAVQTGLSHFLTCYEAQINRSKT